jgi:hypothetical protein
LPPIRVQLADLPALTADAVAEIIDGDPALERVSGPPARIVLVAAAQAELPHRAAPFLAQHSDVVVVGIDLRGGDVASVRMLRHGRPGADGLRGVLRALGGER